jgi:hypothetical protein
MTASSAHVGHQGVVAEGHAALAYHDVVVTGLARLIHHVLHVPGRKELALLDVDRPALAGDVLDEIGLAAQKGRRLQHVDHRRDFRQRGILVHVGQHRHADAVLHLFQDVQALLQPGPR